MSGLPDAANFDYETYLNATRFLSLEQRGLYFNCNASKGAKNVTGGDEK